MGKLQIKIIFFILVLAEINSIQPLEDMKNSLANLSGKNLKKLQSLKTSKNKKIITKIVEPLEVDDSESCDDNDDIEIKLQPCTCGVFLSGQFTKKSPPKGDAVLSHEQENAFPCTPLGIKQCQTKCVEALIKHIPNSANILCANVNRDVHKEKAFLFVQNCNATWHNTKLSGGKEYCCKNNEPYTCPLI